MIILIHAQETIQQFMQEIMQYALLQAKTHLALFSVR